MLGGLNHNIDGQPITQRYVNSIQENRFKWEQLIRPSERTAGRFTTTFNQFHSSLAPVAIQPTGISGSSRMEKSARICNSLSVLAIWAAAKTGVQSYTLPCTDWSCPLACTYGYDTPRAPHWRENIGPARIVTLYNRQTPWAVSHHAVGDLTPLRRAGQESRRMNLNLSFITRQL